MYSVNRSRRGMSDIFRKNLGGLSEHMDDSSSSEEYISGTQSQVDGSGVSLSHTLRGKSFDKPRNKVTSVTDEANDSSGSEDEDDDDCLRSIVQARFGDNQPMSTEEKFEKKAEVEKSVSKIKGVLELILYQRKIQRERNSSNPQNQKEIITRVDRSSSEEEESETEQEVNESDVEDSSSQEEPDVEDSSSQEEPDES